MTHPAKLETQTIDAWLVSHPGWAAEAGVRLVRAFPFPDFAAALAFVVRVGMAAEKRDHHPDVELGWGKARVTWTTHDAAGITSLDLELAATTEAIAAASAT